MVITSDTVSCTLVLCEINYAAKLILRIKSLHCLKLRHISAVKPFRILNQFYMFSKSNIVQLTSSYPGAIGNWVYDFLLASIDVFQTWSIIVMNEIKRNVYKLSKFNYASCKLCSYFAGSKSFTSTAQNSCNSVDIIISITY